MKISKIFHWLYFSVLMLPLALFVPSLVNYSVNKNYSTESVSYYDYDFVQFNQLVLNGNFSNSDNWNALNCSVTYSNNEAVIVPNYTSATNATRLQQTNISSINFINSHKYLTFITCKCTEEGSYLGISFYRSSTSNGTLISNQVCNVGLTTYSQISTYTGGTDTNYLRLGFWNSSIISTFTISNLMVIDLTSMYGSGNEPTSVSAFTSLFSDSYYDYVLSREEYIQDFNTITSSGFEQNLYKRFLDVWDLPMFRWCKDSFLVEPINYICNLFGFGTNAIIYLFDYWLCISIIWLCFDVIMYVPNLMHRWLDRGALE